MKRNSILCGGVMLAVSMGTIVCHGGIVAQERTTGPSAPGEGNVERHAAEAAEQSVLMVDAFDGSPGVNLLGGPCGVFSNPETKHCTSQVVNAPGAGSAKHALQLTYDVSKEGAYGGYWTALMATNVKGYHALRLRLRAPGNIPPLLVGIRHAVTRWDAKAPLGPYLSEPDVQGWRTACIPLTAFIGRGLTDLKLLDTLSLTFENRLKSGAGTLLVSDIAFVPGLATNSLTVADFERWPMEVNHLGGGYRVRQTGAATIQAGYHEEHNSSGKMGTVRVSYGGSIGKDCGIGIGHSYAAWETDLLGLNAHDYDTLVIKIRGEQGGEAPNIYLEDGTTRKPVLAKNLPHLTAEWQEWRIPLSLFAQQGIDLTHLEQLALDFEWQPMSGTLYIAGIRMEQSEKSIQAQSDPPLKRGMP